MPRGTYERTAAWKADISAKLTGRQRTDKQRAMISAGRQIDRDANPQGWQDAFDAYLERIITNRQPDDHSPINLSTEPDPDVLAPEAFPPGVAGRLKAYVYVLLDPRSDPPVPFYIGKGRGNRALSHARAALEPSSEDGESASSMKIDTIRAIHAAGRPVRIEILRHGLDDEQAFEIEAAAIDLMALQSHVLSNQQGGHDSATIGWRRYEDLMAEYAATPVALDDDVILIRPSNTWRTAETDDERYDIARQWWKMSTVRREEFHVALIVVDGIIRDAYRVSAWETDGDRSAFVAVGGTTDNVLQSKYAGHLVPAGTFPRGAANPVRYWKAGDNAAVTP